MQEVKPMKRPIAFDLDGTLTQHRSKLEEQNRRLPGESILK
ncbi:MAG: hypothetical protein ACI4SH_09330 [Candidatus Scatosoma sp.]